MRQQPCSNSQEEMEAEAEAEAETGGGGGVGVRGGGVGLGLGLGGGPPLAPKGVVLPNDFRLTPAQGAPARYIRYSEATGIKLWNAASASLPTKWAVDSEGLSRFNEHVVEREMQSGWNAPGASIMMIPDVNGVLDI
jgi:hypothetical protein